MSDRTKAISASLTVALAFVDKVLALEPSDVQRAAAIQAFEFTYELSWKLMQARLRDEGVNETTPRGVFRASGRAGLIGEVETWLGFLRARNLTSHTYSEAVASQVYGTIVTGFATEVRHVLERVGADADS